MDGKVLISNIDKLHTTKLGIKRIKNNLKLENEDPIEYCRKIILEKDCKILRKGKNWYCEFFSIIITINVYSYTIITAHIKNK